MKSEHEGLRTEEERVVLLVLSISLAAFTFLSWADLSCMELYLISYVVVKKKVPRVSWKGLYWVIQGRSSANHLLSKIKKVGVGMQSFLQKFGLRLDFVWDTCAYNYIIMQMDAGYILLRARNVLNWDFFYKNKNLQ